MTSGAGDTNDAYWLDVFPDSSMKDFELPEISSDGNDTWEANVVEPPPTWDDFCNYEQISSSEFMNSIHNNSGLNGILNGNGSSVSPHGITSQLRELNQTSELLIGNENGRQVIPVDTHFGFENISNSLGNLQSDYPDKGMPSSYNFGNNVGSNAPDTMMFNGHPDVPNSSNVRNNVGSNAPDTMMFNGHPGVPNISNVGNNVGTNAPDTVMFNGHPEVPNSYNIRNNVDSNAPATVMFNGHPEVPNISNVGTSAPDTVMFNGHPEVPNSYNVRDNVDSNAPATVMFNGHPEVPNISNVGNNVGTNAPDTVKFNGHPKVPNSYNIRNNVDSNAPATVMFNGHPEVPNISNVGTNAPDTVKFNGHPEVPNSSNVGNTETSCPPVTANLNGQGMVNPITTWGSNFWSDWNIDTNAQTMQQPALQPSQKDTGKRRETPETSDGPSCSCKKSKCLKRYCECLVTGSYCRDSCTCENCMNNEDFDDSRELSQRKIETNEGTDGNAPKRHKRGCNCKKNNCVKKYCVCYQAEVGCFDACRCEDCRNPFNKKPDTSKIVDLTIGTCSQQNASYDFLGELSPTSANNLPYAHNNNDAQVRAPNALDMELVGSEDMFFASIKEPEDINGFGNDSLKGTGCSDKSILK